MLKTVWMWLIPKCYRFVWSKNTLSVLLQSLLWFGRYFADRKKTIKNIFNWTFLFDTISFKYIFIFPSRFTFLYLFMLKLFLFIWCFLLLLVEENKVHSCFCSKIFQRFDLKAVPLCDFLFLWQWGWWWWEDSCLWFISEELNWGQHEGRLEAVETSWDTFCLHFIRLCVYEKDFLFLGFVFGRSFCFRPGRCILPSFHPFSLPASAL